jgi:hypothetical protein
MFKGQYAKKYSGISLKKDSPEGPLSSNRTGIEGHYVQKGLVRMVIRLKKNSPEGPLH